MRNKAIFAISACGAVLLAAGCNKTPASINTAPFKTALNTYYQSHPTCAFPEALQFPVSITPGGKQPDPAEIQQLNALADAGLVSKSSKKVWTHMTSGGHDIRVHQSEDVYDLTAKGKSAWTAQASGDNAAGNFCYATPQVTKIDHYSPEPNNTRYGVSYDYSIGSMPAWTGNAKVKQAFPTIAAADSAGQSLTGLATLSKTSNGWEASGVTSITSVPVSQQNQGAKADNSSSAGS